MRQTLPINISIIHHPRLLSYKPKTYYDAHGRAALCTPTIGISTLPSRHRAF